MLHIGAIRLRLREDAVRDRTATMSALVYSGPPGGVELTTRPVPALVEESDVLVRVIATGVCGTDRNIVLGCFPAVPGVILGHEAVGEVMAVGPSVISVRPGDPVVINPTYYCTRCQPCRRGVMAHCQAKEGREVGVDRDGTMTGYIVLPERFVHRMPAGMAYRRAVLVEPLACVLNNLSAARPRWDDRILILGAGPIGALCAMVLASRGARVSVVERDPRRAELARDVLPRGVSVAGGPASASRPDVVIDTVGTLLEDALDAIENDGTIVVMGEREGAVAKVGLRSLVTRGIRIIGAGPYPPSAFEFALDLAAELPLESLITHALPLERYTQAFGLLGATFPPSLSPPGYAAMKVLLVSDEQVML